MNMDAVEPDWQMRVLTPKTGTVGGHSQDFPGATADSVAGWQSSNVSEDPLCLTFPSTYHQKIKRTEVISMKPQNLIWETEQTSISLCC